MDIRKRIIVHRRGRGERREINKKGFTVIEIVVSLILVGILTAIAGMWIVSVAQGFVLTKTTASLVQKGQMALTRLTKEFTNLNISADSTNSTSISYTAYSYKDGSKVVRTISWSGTANAPLTLTDNISGDVDTLVDNVSGFTLAYYDSYSSTAQSTWTSERKLIQITLQLTGENGVVSVFAIRITPRNLWN